MRVVASFELDARQPAPGVETRGIRYHAVGGIDERPETSRC